MTRQAFNRQPSRLRFGLSAFGAMSPWLAVVLLLWSVVAASPVQALNLGLQLAGTVKQEYPRSLESSKSTQNGPRITVFVSNPILNRLRVEGKLRFGPGVDYSSAFLESVMLIGTSVYEPKQFLYVLAGGGYARVGKFSGPVTSLEGGAALRLNHEFGGRLGIRLEQGLVGSGNNAYSSWEVVITSLFGGSSTFRPAHTDDLVPPVLLP